MKKAPKTLRLPQPTASAKALRPNATVSGVSTGDSFQNFAARLGYGTGNLSDASQYNPDYISRNRFQLDAMYRSSWICGKAVDTVAEDMTRGGIEITSEIDPSEVTELERLWKALGVWDQLAETIKWARLYGGAIAVILIDGQKLNTPLRVETVSKDQFRGLLPLDRWLVQPSLSSGELVKELGPDLGKPMFYDVIGDSMALSGMRIHYSRVIRLEGQDLPYWQRIAENLWGQSVIERLFDRLLAFDSTTQGAAQLCYKAHLRTYKVENLREIIAAGGKMLEGLTKQIEFIRSTQTNEGLTLMDTKDEFEAHQYTFAGLDTVLLQFGQQLSGALEIPLVRLFGQSPAGLNSTGESDLRTYYDGINTQQERRLRGPVEKLLRISYLSKYGRPLPEGSDFAFSPLWQLSDKEKGEIATAVTNAVTSAKNANLIGRKTALKELKQSSRITGIWSNIDDAQIEAADDEVMDFGEGGGGMPGLELPDGDRDTATPEGNDDEPGVKKKTLKTADQEWNEGDHPRKEDGEFTAGGGTPYDTPAVVAARKKIAGARPTSEIHTPEREALRDRIAEELYKPKGVAAKRQAHLVIGPPAAGKSSIAEPLATLTRSLLIDSDQAKEKLPEFEGGVGAAILHEESSRIAKSIIRRATNAGLNIVHPIIGKSLESVRRLRDDLVAEGYDVHLVHSHLEAHEAAKRAVTRFEKTGRFVDPAYVLSVGNKPRENYEILKGEGGFKSYEQYSQDVPLGDSPRLIERIDRST